MGLHGVAGGLDQQICHANCMTKSILPAPASWAKDRAPRSSQRNTIVNQYRGSITSLLGWTYSRCQG